jgi:hypothetical protein
MVGSTAVLHPQEENEAVRIDLGPIRTGPVGMGSGQKSPVHPGDVPVHLAIQLMSRRRRGRTHGGGSSVRQRIVDDGDGWLGAYLVLSGSPVAATAISLFGAGTTSVLQTFTMLSGSRLGASFIVLRPASYAMRNPRRDANRWGRHQAMTMPPSPTSLGCCRLLHLARGLLNGINWRIGKLGRPSRSLDVRRLAKAPGWALFVVGIARSCSRSS